MDKRAENSVWFLSEINFLIQQIKLYFLDILVSVQLVSLPQALYMLKYMLKVPLS